MMEQKVNKYMIYDINHNNMQTIISQLPELTPFLSRIPKQQHRDAIKHLIRLGLEATQSYCCKENQYDSSNVLQKEISILKDNVEVLNQMVKHQCHHHCHYCYPGQSINTQSPFFQTQPKLNDHKALRKNTENIIKPSKDIHSCQRPGKQSIKTQTKQDKGTTGAFNPFLKQKPFVSRHHLDDTGVREALEFPPETLIEPSPKIKRRSQDYKKHIYQEEINKEEIVRIKQDKGESLDKSRKDRAVSDYTKTTSKIKPLIDKDRIRFMQRKHEYEFKEGFNKYEYSDESQMEESSMRENQNTEAENQKYQKFIEENTYNPHLQSNFKESHQASSQKSHSHNKTSSKKEFSRSRNEAPVQGEVVLLEQYLQDKSKSGSKGEAVNQYQDKSAEHPHNIEYDMQDEDVVSNSSSFSQFSINGSRKKEVGKISRRSQND